MELRQIHERRGGITLIGGCHEDTSSMPYFPFRESFRVFFHEWLGEVLSFLETLPDYSQRELTRILPGLKKAQTSESDQTPDPFRLFEGFRLFLQYLSNIGVNRPNRVGHPPLLFIIEDLHWSDEASLDLLQYLARNLKEEGILLCGTYRTEEAVGERGLSLFRFRGSLRREKLLEEITLQPLSRDGMSTMLRLLCPGMKILQEIHELLYQKTEGNPFFLEEVLRSHNVGEFLEGKTYSPGIMAVPQSIHDVIERRIELLSPEIKEVLTCAALLGEEFEFRVLEKVLDRTQREILRMLEAGMKSQIIRESFEEEGERYRF
jgi:hypothetical protein